MPKIIVFSGHGDWQLGNEEFVKLPAKCSIRFYTLNMKTLSDAFGGELDQGKVAGIEPDQEAGPFMTVPDMRLYPPTDPPLHIRTPDLGKWNVLRLPAPVPVDDKNIQVQIDDAYGGGADLKIMFEILEPAIRPADAVTFIWAACRAINLKGSGGQTLGVNELQRWKIRNSRPWAF